MRRDSKSNKRGNVEVWHTATRPVGDRRGRLENTLLCATAFPKRHLLGKVAYVAPYRDRGTAPYSCVFPNFALPLARLVLPLSSPIVSLTVNGTSVPIKSAPAPLT